MLLMTEMIAYNLFNLSYALFLPDLFIPMHFKFRDKFLVRLYS